MDKDTFNYEAFRNHFDGELRDRILDGADYLRQSGHGSTVIMDGSAYSPCFRAILPPGMDEWFVLADGDGVDNAQFAYDASIERAYELASENGVTLEESYGNDPPSRRRLTTGLRTCIVEDIATEHLTTGAIHVRPQQSPHRPDRSDRLRRGQP